MHACVRVWAGSISPVIITGYTRIGSQLLRGLSSHNRVHPANCGRRRVLVGVDQPDNVQGQTIANIGYPITASRLSCVPDGCCSGADPGITPSGQKKD